MAKTPPPHPTPLPPPRPKPGTQEPLFWPAVVMIALFVTVALGLLLVVVL